MAAIAAGSFLFTTGAAHTAGKQVNSEACTDGWVADGTAGNGGKEMAEVGSDGAGVIVEGHGSSEGSR